MVNTTPSHAVRDTPAYRFRWIPVPEPTEDTGEPTGDTGETGEPPQPEDTGSGNPPEFTPTVTGKHSEGCQCAASSGSGLLWLGPLVLLAWRRSDTGPG